MKPSLHSPTYNKWLQMLGTLTVSGGLTLTALAVNPGTSNPGGKTNGEAQEKSDGEEQPSQGDGKDCDGTEASKDKSSNPNGDGEGEEDCPECEPNEGPGCIREQIPLAIAPNEPGLGSGMIKLYIDATGPNLGSREHLDFFGLPQMSITQVEPQGAVTNYGIVQAGSTLIPFKMNSGLASVGLPTGASAYSQARLNYVSPSGAVSDKSGAASVRHYRSSAGYMEYPVAGGTASKYVTKEGRQYAFPLSGMEVIREKADGSFSINGNYGSGLIRQVKTVAGLLDVVVLSTRSYEIRKYAPQHIGAKSGGVYTTTGAPYLTMKVEAPANTLNALVVTKTEGTWQEVSNYLCSFTGGSEVWTQQVTSGGFTYKRELKREPMNNLGPDYRRTTRSAKMLAAPGLPGGSPAGPPGYQAVSDTYKYLPTATSQTSDTGSLHTRSLSFSAPSWDANGVGRPTGKTNSKGGSWSAGYEADTGRMTGKSATVARPVNGGGAAPANRVEEYSYQPLASGESLSVGDFRPRSKVLKLDGVVVGKSFLSATNVGGSYVEKKERTVSATGNYGDAGNIRQEKKWYGAGANQGRIEQELKEDGTLTRYEYVAQVGGGLLVTTFETLTPAGAAVSGHSTRTKELRDVRGWPVAITKAHYVNNAWLDYETIHQTYNAAGRLIGKQRQDLVSNQTRTLLTQEWDGRLLTREIDEQGIATSYEYFPGSELVEITRREAIPAQGTFAAQAEIVTTYSGTFTTNVKQVPEWRQRTTTITAGALTLNENHTFDEKGRTVSHTDKNGYSTTTAYSNNDLVKTETWPNGATRITTKDSEGRTLSITGTGVIAEYYHYTPLPGGGERTTVYTGQDNGPRFVIGDQDGSKRPIQIVSPGFGSVGSATTSYTYSNTFPKEVVLTTQSGLPNKICNLNAVGICEQEGWSADNNTLTLASNTDRITNTVTATEQDSGGLWIATRKYVYPLAGDANAKLVSTRRQKLAGFTGTETKRTESVDVAGNATVAITLLAGSLREERVSRPAVTGEEIDIYYGGRMMARVKPGISGMEEFGYDTLGREVSQKEPRHTNSSFSAYFASSNLIASLTDAAGNATTYTYHSQGSAGAGLLRSSTLPDNSVLFRAYTLRNELKVEWGSQTYPLWKEYNAWGELTTLHSWQTAPSLDIASIPSVPPSGSAATVWNYDASTGLLGNKRYADNKGPDYSYDVAGRLTRRLWARLHAGQRLATDYNYDGFGQLTSIDYADSTPDVIESHDRLGRLMSQSNGVAQTLYAYSPTTLLLTGETVSYDLDRNGTPELVRQIARTQDAYLRNAGYQLKDGATVETDAIYTYDGVGRFATIGSTASGSFTYGYTTGSHLIASITGPTHSVANIWETDRDVLSNKENKVGTTVVSSFDYGVNAIGQRIGVSQSGNAFVGARSVAWEYDLLGQVISADSSEAGHDRAFQYDSIGNRKKSADSLTLPSNDNYTSNSLNQYTVVAALSPVYDADGNATAYALPVSATTNSTITWEAENRQVATTVGGVTTTCLYDAVGRRIAKTTGANTTLWLYNGWNPIGEYAGGNLVKTNLWGLDLSGSFQGVGGVGGLLSVCSSNVPYFPTYDGGGNVSEYVGGNGIVAAHFEYDAFGRMVVNTDAANMFSHRFSTKPFDGETGLYNYGYRYYDPQVGRWLSRDPKEENFSTGEFNVYAAFLNDAIDNIDLLGLIRIGIVIDGNMHPGNKPWPLGSVNNCLGGATTNDSGVFAYPENDGSKDNTIGAMKKDLGYNCKEVKNMESCKCACEEEKVLITLYKNNDPRNKGKNPWTDPNFKFGDYFGDSRMTDIHAIRADRGCDNNYKQVPKTLPGGKGQGNFNKDIDKKLFDGSSPLLCCCRAKK